MKIGIDIDDTLSFLEKTRVKTAKKYLKRNHLNYKLIRKDTHLFSEMFNWPQEECDKFWFEMADDMLLKAPVRKDASKVIKRLKKEGNEIIIITARTQKWHKNPFQMSEEWLNNNHIPYDELLVGFLDKTEICKEKGIDVFIDDMPNTLKKLKPFGIETMLMKNSYNVDEKDLKLVKNWKEIYNNIKKIELRNNI